MNNLHVASRRHGVRSYQEVTTPASHDLYQYSTSSRSPKKYDEKEKVTLQFKDLVR